MFPNDMTNPDTKIQELNGLRPNGFTFTLQKLPQTSFFCQAAELPAVTLNAAVMPTPLVDIPQPGDKLAYDSLNIRFVVQENLQNYLEIYSWLVTLGFPVDRAQFTTRNPTGVTLSDTRPSVRKNDLDDYSDAVLSILGAQNTVVGQFRFVNCFPVSLGTLQFDTTEPSPTNYMVATATFRYTYFEPVLVTEIA